MSLWSLWLVLLFLFLSIWDSMHSLDWVKLLHVWYLNFWNHANGKYSLNEMRKIYITYHSRKRKNVWDTSTMIINSAIKMPVKTFIDWLKVLTISFVLIQFHKRISDFYLLDNIYIVLALSTYERRFYKMIAILWAQKLPLDCINKIQN